MNVELYIDTDLGVDDALALAVALNARTARVPLITTVAGNVPVAQATYNTRVVLEVLRDSTTGELPSVVEGHGRPLVREPIFATDVHGGDGLGGVSRRQGQDSRLTYPPSEPAVAGAFAPRSWLSLQPPLERRVLVTLGPLTNLAAAVLADPSFPERFDEIIALGGAVHGSGNITPFAEFNIFADPEAAAIAVRTVGNLRIIPLEICARYILTEQTLIEAARSERRVARFMRSIHEEYIAWYRDKEGIDGCYPHDSFAVLAALHPNAFRYEAVTLDVNCNVGDERYGQTRCLSSPGLPVKLCVDVDADLIASAIRDVLFGPR